MQFALHNFIPGPDHPDVVGHRSNLATILLDLGEPLEARKQIALAL